MHKTFIWKPTGWDIGSCDIVWDSPCSGTLVKEQAFLYPSIFSLFLSFLALLSSFQACRVNCRTADFVMIEISWETSRKKKCCKNKATEGWRIHRDGSKKCGQMNVYPTWPWHRSESPAATLQQSWTSLHASQFLFSLFLPSVSVSFIWL